MAPQMVSQGVQTWNGLDPLQVLKDRLRVDARGVLAELRESGVLGIFERTVRRHMGGNLPRSVELYFGTVVRTRTARPLPRSLWRRFGLCQGLEFNYYVAQGIGVFVVNGVIRDFVVHRELVRLEASQRPAPPPRRRHRRKDWEPLRGSNDSLRIGASMVAFDGYMAAHLRELQALRSGEPRG